MPLRSKSNNACAATLALFLLGGCVTVYNPATEKRESLLISTEGEVAIGRDMDKEIRKKYAVVDDYRTQARLNAIGRRVAAASDRQDVTYYFNAIQDKELNAFATPGGYVYVNSGLMEAANDDELACVLAHEIGHIAARHSVKKLQTVMGYQILMGIALGVSGQQTMGKAMDVVFDLVHLGYSRKDELLADKLSVRYARRAGFSPYAMVTFLKKLDTDSVSAGTHYKPAFLSSHPQVQERIKYVESEIASYN